MTCTEFCNKINSLQLTGTRLPDYNRLVSHLGYPIETLRSGVLLGTLEEVSSRRSCPFCSLVLEAVHQASSTTELVPAALQNKVYILLLHDEQSFRLSFPSPHGTRLCFLAEYDNQISGPGLARPVGGTSIDPSTILKWLDTCNHDHGQMCYHDRSQEPIPSNSEPGSPFNLINFRVIDVVRGCITPASLDCRFLTLSYVWGQTPTYRLQRDNRESLANEGSLQYTRQHLPQTVNDAIDLTASLGERYLWIDALCLIQDDEDDLGSGVRIMNSIYERSYLTIIAASGANAGAGLPGIHPGSRNVKQVSYTLESGAKMTVLHSIDKHLARSPYNDRAWTLQELILPRRSVIFVGGQVHFRCHESNWSEDTTADTLSNWTDPDDSNLMRIPAYEDGPIAVYWANMKLAEDFSSRTLRFDGDALRAFYGISRPVAASLECDLLEGLPLSYFDMSLLFLSTKGDLRRRSGFASWSWAGWSGPIAWPRENYHSNEDELHFFDTTNVHKWCETMTFVGWTAWHPDDESSPCTDTRCDSAGLGRLLTHFQGILPKASILEIAEGRKGYHSCASCFSSSKLGRKIDDTHDKSHLFSSGRADLCDSQRELDELSKNIVDSIGRRVMMNWMASRRYAVHRAKMRDERRADKPVRRRKYWSSSSESAHTNFRSARGPQIAQDEIHKDRRWKRLDRAMAGQNVHPLIKGHDILFPQYSVLSCQTITIRLMFGDEYKADDLAANVQATRVKGAELFDNTNSVCGEMYLDDVQEWRSRGHVECILLSWCVRSPITDRSTSWEQPEDLIWVMCIRWDHGIAERRGIGKVSASAVRKSLVPAFVKPILLA